MASPHALAAAEPLYMINDDVVDGLTVRGNFAPRRAVQWLLTKHL